MPTWKTVTRCAGPTRRGGSTLAGDTCGERAAETARVSLPEQRGSGGRTMYTKLEDKFKQQGQRKHKR